MDVENLNKSLLVKTLNFHGIQLQKIFETEYANFPSLKLDSNLHFNEYTKRQKQLSFQDRGKRFRLQQFVCKHVSKLFTRHVKSWEDIQCPKQLDVEYSPILPPFEWFLTVDKEMRLQRFFEYVRKGDIVAASVVGKTAAGIILKLLYGECDEIRCVSDVGIKAFVPTSALIPAVEKNAATTRAFLLNDLVCCEVLEISPDTEKIVCGMKGILCLPENRRRLGLMHSDNYPIVFRKFLEKKKDSYSVLLENSESFNNPNLVNNLLTSLGVHNELYSHFDYLKGKFPEKEYATELRQAQAAKWSFHSVTEGIEHFKCGKYTEAFQCLNKALTIDPRNIEALVARGALYANSGSYEKAILDFESALKFNLNHQNAKKYLGDTLIAYGRTHEENGKFSDAIKAYEYCISLVPNHEEACNSLQFLKTKLQTSKKHSDDSLVELKKIQDINSTLSQLLTQSEDKQLLLREMKKLKMKKRMSSSSSSSSSSDSSSDSSTDSTSSSGSSIRVKKKKSRSKRESSLSPLSKRMALMESAAMKDGFPSVSSSASIYNPSSIPYVDESSNFCAVNDAENEYEIRVRKFLEETKRDDEYEEKVRKFLDETAKWKKKQKIKEEKSRKKKKEKKSKSKKKKKDSKRKKKQMKEEKKRKNRSEADSNEELNLPEKYLGCNSFKELEELQNRLSAYYSKVEKNSKSKKEKRKQKRMHSSKRKSSESETSSDETEKDHYSMEKEKSDMVDEPTSPTVKPEISAIKFKMQVPPANKLQKRSSIEHVWEDEKNASEEEPEPEMPPVNPKVERQEYNGRPPTTTTTTTTTTVEVTPRNRDTPPRMDKLGGFHIKKSPKRDLYSPGRSTRKSSSRSRSRSRTSPKRSPSNKRARRSRSHSRHSSSPRGKYSRYSRSKSYSRSRSRSRSRSPYYRSRYQSRGRGSGTYYKPRIPNYRGYYRGNWRNNNFGGRNRAYNPRYRGNRRPYYQDYKNKDDRDYQSRRSRRSPSDEDNGSWRDDSKERMMQKRSGSGERHHREESTHAEYTENQAPSAAQVAEPSSEELVK